MRKKRYPANRRYSPAVRPTCTNHSAGRRQKQAPPQTSASHPEQGISLGWAVDKLITPLLIGAILAVFGIFAPPWIADRLKAPTCDDPRDLRLATPDQVEGESKPSDNFPRKGIIAYGVANLIDGNTSTAWVENKPGLGLGSQFTLRFKSTVDVRLVCLVDGYAESWDLYKRNSRARLLTVDTRQGTRAALLRDAGSPIGQRLSTGQRRSRDDHVPHFDDQRRICRPTRHHGHPCLFRHLDKRSRSLDRTMTSLRPFVVCLLPRAH